MEVVISRYNEDLKFLTDDIFQTTPIWVYNKGPNQNFTTTANTFIMSLPNVGRECHTYLHHIIEHYDTLPTITVFLPGSTDFEVKWRKTIAVISEARSTRQSAMVYDAHTNIRDLLYKFTIESHRSENETNLQANPAVSLEPSPIRPYGAWYDYWFPDTYQDYLSYNSILAIHRKHIQNRPKEFYMALIQEVANSPNPETVHYIERSWNAIFHPMDNANFISIDRIL